MSENSDHSKGVCLDVYGCRFLICGNATSSIEDIASDFQFFLTGKFADGITVEILSADPPYEDVPDGIATTYTPRNTAFTSDGLTYIDYSGKALAIWDRVNRSFRVTSRECDIQYEATYLFLLSQIGECLDRRQMHRIHAMAVGIDGRSVLAILPMGGGKSTLCSALLKYPEFSMLSDDSPFIGADGRVFAFPLRLGLLPGGERDIPKEYLRTVNRMEFGPKILVSYDYFADRIETSAAPGIVFLGRRSMNPDCRIEPAGKWMQYKSMIVNCVVGLGLYQGLEFVLTHSPLELLSKSRIAWSRFRAARKLFSRSNVYVLTLGRDQQLNAAKVREFVLRELSF